jgi:hypothetical protein
MDPDLKKTNPFNITIGTINTGAIFPFVETRIEIKKLASDDTTTDKKYDFINNDEY